MIYIILLRFTEKKDQAARFMAAHKEWLERGFSDGFFMLAGTLQAGSGGSILAKGERTEIERRVNEDPFVSENIVTAEILEITPLRTDHRLDFLRQ